MPFVLVINCELFFLTYFVLENLITLEKEKCAQNNKITLIWNLQIAPKILKRTAVLTFLCSLGYNIEIWIRCQYCYSKSNCYLNGDILFKKYKEIIQMLFENDTRFNFMNTSKGTPVYGKWFWFEVYETWIKLK